MITLALILTMVLWLKSWCLKMRMDEAEDQLRHIDRRVRKLEEEQ